MSLSNLPADLLQAVVSRQGRVALVVGAGCSIEDPTRLKLSSEYSLDVHAQLVADGVIQEGDVRDVEDLSVLAEFVVEKTGSKRAVVDRLPRSDFRVARPNSGHLDAVALMIEGAVSCVITLNYDLALTNALVPLGANDIEVIRGAETMTDLGSKCIIYLHGKADSASEDWILLKSEIEEAWQDTWMDLVTTRVSTTPFLIFVGLGSPTVILTESVNRVRQIGLGAPQFYLVDPDNTSPFAHDLSLPERNVMNLTWCEFMALLAKRVVRECCEEIRRAAKSLCVTQGWTIEDGRFEDLVASLKEAGLRTLGMLRAVWLCKPVPYHPDSESARAPMAQLLLAFGKVLADTRHDFTAVSDGRIQVSTSNTRVGSVMGLHGAGVNLWAQAQTMMLSAIDGMSDQPDVVLAAGFTGPSIEELAPPESVVHGYRSEDDILAAPHTPRLVAIDEILGSDLRFKDLVS